MQSPVLQAWLWDEQKRFSPCSSDGASGVGQDKTEQEARSDEWWGKVHGAMKIQSK